VFLAGSPVLLDMFSAKVGKAVTKVTLRLPLMRSILQRF